MRNDISIKKLSNNNNNDNNCYSVISFLITFVPYLYETLLLHYVYRSLYSI